MCASECRTGLAFWNFNYSANDKSKEGEKNWLKINDVQSLKVFFIAVAGGPAVRGIKAESVTDEILRDAKQ